MLIAGLNGSRTPTALFAQILLPSHYGTAGGTVTQMLPLSFLILIWSQHDLSDTVRTSLKHLLRLLSSAGSIGRTTLLC
jgi:hypothetical protein